MKRTNNRMKTKKLRNTQQRRTMLKKLHQRVLQRRKQFQAAELNESYAKAC